jgi:para-aminobenzoate synthetase component 1
MATDPHYFWMGRTLARGLEEVTSNPEALSDGNFWAVTTTFEGEYSFARFSDISQSDFPKPASAWNPLEGHWKTSLDKNEFCKYVETIRKAISEGIVYQVNACRELSITCEGQNLDELFYEILRRNPAPYAAYLKLPELEIASASPEKFMTRRGHLITTSPIKGTQVLSEKNFGSKDQAENIMIVDLMRNDFGRICEAGSVRVSALLRSEDHPGLRHLVSDVEGELPPSISWEQIFQALLPPGSVSGTPKSSALHLIAENEPTLRSLYCGTIGWVHGDQAEFSVAIRTFFKEKDEILRFGTGAGITWASDAEEEWEETQLKARTLLSIAGGTTT